MFCTFIQNNSSGCYVENDNVSVYTIIECDSVADANERAEAIGIYFNGVSDGRDCECCGDRWSRVYSDTELFKKPTIYGEPVVVDMESTNHRNCIIHYKNGNTITGIA